MVLRLILTMCLCPFFFFFNDTATTEIYTLSLHDALPISTRHWPTPRSRWARPPARPHWPGDRKSTRLNSSHITNSYAVFCLKKKNKIKKKKKKKINKKKTHTKNRIIKKR